MSEQVSMVLSEYYAKLFQKLNWTVTTDLLSNPGRVTYSWIHTLKETMTIQCKVVIDDTYRIVGYDCVFFRILGTADSLNKCLAVLMLESSRLFVGSLSYDHQNLVFRTTHVFTHIPEISEHCAIGNILFGIDQCSYMYSQLKQCVEYCHCQVAARLDGYENSGLKQGLCGLLGYVASAN